MAANSSFPNHCSFTWLWLRSSLAVKLVLTAACAIASPLAQAFTTVVIDAGHGGKDPGATWYGIKEKNLCLDTAKRIERALKTSGLRVILTRSTDVFLELSARAKVANRYPGAIFVSIHFDATRDRTASGFTTHYMSRTGRKLALKIQASLDKRIPGLSRGVDAQNYKVLRETKGTAVLVECGFISNRKENTRCADPDHRQAIAEAIARGIVAAK
jgi:N-acetylmuramoyl-L-alanine amidase